MKSKFTVVVDTPVYVQNVLSGLNLSEVSVCITFRPQYCTCYYLTSSRKMTFKTSFNLIIMSGYMKHIACAFTKLSVKDSSLYIIES